MVLIDASARFVKVLLNAKDYFRLDEVEIYGA
jgi:hypothetical protein